MTPKTATDDGPSCPWCGIGPNSEMSGGQTWDKEKDRGTWCCGSFKRGPEPRQSIRCELNVADANSDVLLAKVKRLREALRHYGSHCQEPACASLPWRHEPTQIRRECDCGLDAALKENP